MDQAKLADQGLLRHRRECSEDLDLDRRLDLCPGRHRPQTSWPGEESLPNFRDSQHHYSRESAHITGVRSIRLPTRLTLKLKPADSLQVLAGQ
jgi:hypothetical protein